MSDVNRDGQADLLVEFEKRGLRGNRDVVAGSSTLILLGRFRDGRILRGADVVAGN